MTTTTQAPPAAAIPSPGFADPVLDAQRVFRSVLDALARPLRPVTLPVLSPAAGALSAVAASIALTLCDDATPVWLDPALAADPSVGRWLTFHTSAPIVADASEALFAFVSAPQALPSLSAFDLGTDEAPHLSATVIVMLDGSSGTALTASGPGFEHPLPWKAPAVPAWFLDEWSAGATRFPRGTDLLFTGHDAVTGLPRTTRLAADAAEGEH